MDMENKNLKKKYPIRAEYYTLYEEVGTGASASVHRALCNPLNEIIAIKILDFERSNVDLSNISREAQTMVLLDHPNVLKSHCSFVTDHSLWVVMPYMSGGSCLHILKATHPDGFEENVIATVLREVLKGLDYVHQHGHIHRDVKAGNILIDSHGGIKLGDFGVSAYLFDSGDRKRMRNTFVGTPCWMAPEVMEQLHGYDFKADIWSFGITALELAHGHAPFSKYPPMKVLLMTLQNAPPSLDYERDKKFSKMIASCLVKDPSKRPTAKKLLKHSFFKQAKSNDYIAKTLLDGQPALGDRFQSIKKKEDMLEQKKMRDGEKEEISQNEYKRGISCWDFNVDDLKAEASLIQDDEFILEKDEDFQAKQLHHLSSQSKNFQRQSSFATRSSHAVHSDDNIHASVLPSIDSTVNITKSETLDGYVCVSDSTIEQTTGCMRVGQSNQVGNYVTDVNGKLTDGEFTTSSQWEKVQNQSQNLLHTGATNPQTIDNAQPEISPVNGEEIDEKTKNPAIQQKGRFKVTSENVEMEKGAPGPVLHKSVSLQVIPQNPALSSSLNDPVPRPANPIYKLYPSLHSVLQANILERDNILKVMKQAAAGDCSDTGPLPISSEVTERSSLEAANDSEKDLLGQIIDLQLRLMSAQDELRKYKPDYQRG